MRFEIIFAYFNQIGYIQSSFLVLWQRLSLFRIDFSCSQKIFFSFILSFFLSNFWQKNSFHFFLLQLLRISIKRRKKYENEYKREKVFDYHTFQSHLASKPTCIQEFPFIKKSYNFRKRHLHKQWFIIKVLSYIFLAQPKYVQQFWVNRQNVLKISIVVALLILEFDIIKTKLSKEILWFQYLPLHWFSFPKSVETSIRLVHNQMSQKLFQQSVQWSMKTEKN